MKQEKVSAILMTYRNYIPDNRTLFLKNALDRANDNVYEPLSLTKLYNPTATLLFSIFLGGFAVDRFYIGDFGIGILKLLLLNCWFLMLVNLFAFLFVGLFPTFVFWFVDIFLSYRRAKRKNLTKLLEVITTPTYNY